MNPIVQAARQIAKDAQDKAFWCNDVIEDRALNAVANAFEAFAGEIEGELSRAAMREELGE